MLPTFRRLEDDLDFADAPYHASGGPIPVYRAPIDQWGPLDRAFRTVALDLGCSTDVLLGMVEFDKETEHEVAAVALVGA